MFLEPVTLGVMTGLEIMEGDQQLLEKLSGAGRGENNTLASLVFSLSSLIPGPPITEQSWKQQGGLGNGVGCHSFLE